MRPFWLVEKFIKAVVGSSARSSKRNWKVVKVNGAKFHFRERRKLKTQKKQSLNWAGALI